MLSKIQGWFKADRVYYSKHARGEMEDEESGEIRDEEVFETILTGKIIGNYPEDEPYPSCLIFINAAIFLGWISYLSGETYTTWQPEKR
jgi:hypothetical protein